MTTMIELSELTGDYILDTAYTRIGFVAKHTIGPKVRGQFHAFEGSAHIDADPSRSSAAVTVLTNSIDTGNAQRDQLLCGKYLDVADHPAIFVTAMSVRPGDLGGLTAVCDVTIRGVTKQVTSDVVAAGAHPGPDGEFRVRFEGSTTINRKDWGVHWSVASGMVGRKVVLEFDIVAIRQP
ncbi:YceI family protein [Nocardia thraciensis]